MATPTPKDAIANSDILSHLFSTVKDARIAIIKDGRMSLTAEQIQFCVDSEDPGTRHNIASANYKLTPSQIDKLLSDRDANVYKSVLMNHGVKITRQQYDYGLEKRINDSCLAQFLDRHEFTPTEVQLDRIIANNLNSNMLSERIFTHPNITLTNNQARDLFYSHYVGLMHKISLIDTEQFAPNDVDFDNILAPLDDDGEVYSYAPQIVTCLLSKFTNRIVTTPQCAAILLAFKEPSAIQPLINHPHTDISIDYLNQVLNNPATHLYPETAQYTKQFIAKKESEHLKNVHSVLSTDKPHNNAL